MTLSQAQRRYPHVPTEIVQWAVENIPDPRDVERGLKRLEDSRRAQVKFAAALAAS